MSSVNKVFLVGRLGDNPDIRMMQSGDKVASFSLATSESWKDKDTGERKERTQWHNVVVFNKGLISVVESYVKKGSKIYVEGQLETRKWQDQSGDDRYTTEITLRPYRGDIVLLDSKPQEKQAAPDMSAHGGMEDDIPFMRFNDFIGA